MRRTTQPTPTPDRDPIGCFTMLVILAVIGFIIWSRPLEIIATYLIAGCSS